MRLQRLRTFWSVAGCRRFWEQEFAPALHEIATLRFEQKINRKTRLLTLPDKTSAQDGSPNIDM
jgi:hypothetical protein